MGSHVALLRAVNVAGQRRVPMAELRALAAEIGFEGMRTFGASGNLVFDAAGKPAALEAKLERALETHFGFSVDAMVRTAPAWTAYRDANPFPGESRTKGKSVLLYVGKEAADDAMVDALRTRAAEEERVERTGDALWIWFAQGGGRSRLAAGPKPGLWTGRNWNTVAAIAEALCSPSR